MIKMPIDLTGGELAATANLAAGVLIAWVFVDV